MPASPGGKPHLKSMTGFANGGGESSGWTWTTDIRSVNGRGLDLRFRLPDWIPGLDADLRKLIQTKVSRGSVTVNLRVQRDTTEEGAGLSQSGLSHALKILADIETSAKEAGVTLRGSAATDIAHMRGVLETADVTEEDTKALKAAILAQMPGVLDAFVANRASEGAALTDILSAQLDDLVRLKSAAVEAIGDRAVAVRAAMDRALKRLLEATEVPDPERLTHELALIAVKSDVSEELDRLDAHIDAARALLRETAPVGRKFDFLMQEFNREANTLCSKSQSTALTAVGLELKTVIDQMREQVQNVE